MCTAAAAFTGVGTVRYLAPDPWAIATGVSRGDRPDRGRGTERRGAPRILGPDTDRWVVAANLLFLGSVASRDAGLDHPTIERNRVLEPETTRIVTDSRRSRIDVRDLARDVDRDVPQRALGVDRSGRHGPCRALRAGSERLGGPSREGIVPPSSFPRGIPLCDSLGFGPGGAVRARRAAVQVQAGHGAPPGGGTADATRTSRGIDRRRCAFPRVGPDPPRARRRPSRRPASPWRSRPCSWGCGSRRPGFPTDGCPRWRACSPCSGWSRSSVPW